MRIAPASVVRNVIAQALLGAERSPVQGAIELRPHQRDGVERLERIITEHRGALLADDVGLGKTFTALSLRGADAALVLAPAVLRDQWLASAQRAGRAIRFVSIESLSRESARERFPFVIIDEAHHLRNRNTLRFVAARELCRDASVLLLSATPIHNRESDLRAILSLFLGERAYGLSGVELQRLVLRRRAVDAMDTGLPEVGETVMLQPPADVDHLDAIMNLPPPLPASDEGDGGVLVTWSLVRQWGSSHAALRGGLRRRLARARAIEDALAAGRHPSRAELAGWLTDCSAQQLAMPELMLGTAAVSPGMLAAVARHREALAGLLGALRNAPDCDGARAGLLSGLMREHPGETIVAFSEFADTVRGYFARLAPQGRVALLTHHGGRIASGPVARSDVLSLMRARTDDARLPISLLLATDLLSEGVDLQRASVVVHLDLPWTAARMQQRVGRLRRPGASRSRISVFAIAPPAPAEKLLRVETRVRAKLAVARRALGCVGSVLPGTQDDVTSESQSSGKAHEVLLGELRSWRNETTPEVDVACAMRASIDGAIACVRCDGAARLVAFADSRWTDRPEKMGTIVRAAGTARDIADSGAVASAAESLRRWMSARRVEGIIDLSTSHVARSRRTLLRRAAEISGAIPHHRRAEVGPLLRSARRVATATLSAGAESVLASISDSSLPDSAWLQALHEFAMLHVRPNGSESEIVALIALVSPEQAKD